MKHNTANKKSGLGRKIVSGALAAGVTLLAMAGDTEAGTQHGPNKGGDGKQNELNLNPAKGGPIKGGGDGQQDYPVPDPERDKRAAAVVADGLNASMSPVQPGAKKGGDSNPELNVMDGFLEAVDEDTGDTIRIVDPIVPSTEKPLGELATSWVVVQGYDGKGQLMFRPLDLSEYEWVTIHPVDPMNPYMSTHGTFIPAKGKPGQEQMQMIESGPNGEDIPNADVAGQVYGSLIQKGGQPQ